MNEQRSQLPPHSPPRRSTGDWADKAVGQHFEGAADPEEAAEEAAEEMAEEAAEEMAEEAAEEASRTEDHRTHQEEYREMHRPYPTPPTNLSAYRRKYSQGIEPKRKTSCYSGARTAAPTETIPRWQYCSRRP